jgi:prepilin-type N-terminal cleavage/methylation domain-containing protein/prepilin-type processing-associated H-X9-DG protein
MRRTTKFGACAGRGFDKQGFTLIELLTVVAIIAVLAAIVVPTMSTARGRARQAICVSNLRQLGFAFNMYADDNSGFLPAPTTNFGFQLCWFYALDPYIAKQAPSNTPSLESRIALIKQDPIWEGFGAGRTNERTYKMNRKLIGNAAQGTSVQAQFATPPWRRISDIKKAATTPLVFDGRCEETGSSADRARFDGWETYCGLRHRGGASICFVDTHVEYWTKGSPHTGGVGGWQTDTGLDWWVDQ